MAMTLVPNCYEIKNNEEEQGKNKKKLKVHKVWFYHHTISKYEDNNLYLILIINVIDEHFTNHHTNIWSAYVSNIFNKIIEIIIAISLM